MPGVPFLPNQLGAAARLVVEIAWGANLTADPATWTWTDVSTDVRTDSGISITLGRPEESSQAPPATCSLRLNNRSGAYSAFNALAPNYPNVRENTPVRVRVTLDGSNFFTRFEGYANGFTPGWDAQGKFAYAMLTAAGITRRLIQGSKPLKSALHRAILASNPIGYWPMSDGVDGDFFGSALPFGTPMTVNFGSGVTLANKAGPFWMGGNYPAFTAGTVTPCSAPVPVVAAASWRVECMVRNESSGTVIAWNTTGTGAQWQLVVASKDNPPTAVNVSAINSSGTFIATAATSPNLVDEWYHYRVEATQNGGNVSVTVSLNGTAIYTNSTFFAGTVGSVNLVMGLNGASFGEVAVWAAFNGVIDTAAAFLGYRGETADARLTRLCSEENVPLTVTGTSSTTMGPQTTDSFINLIRECETTDVGMLVDGLGAGLSYVARPSRYNQTAALTLDANAGQVPADPLLRPLQDDQRRRNRVTAQRRNGASYTAEDSTGPVGTAAVGVYDTSVTVNLDSDGSPLADQATWGVHLGTVEGLRYPSVYADLAGAPELASAWLATTPAERVDLANLSNRLPQHPTGTVSLVAEGYTEFLNSRMWTVAVNCSPYRPWEVFTIQDTRLGRVETSGSQLHQNYSAGATSLLVDITSGPLWDTASAPFDVEIRGLQITVTAISGSSSPQTLTVNATPGDVGGGNPVHLWKPGVIAL